MQEWFGGRVDGGEDADAFLAAARDAAPALLGGLVDPDDTGAIPYGCLLTIDVPGVPPSEWPVHTHMLQVMFEAGRVGGYWGCSHLWDGWDREAPESLHVEGDLTPQELAVTAARWLAEQLRRPLVRQEWDRRVRPAKVRWLLQDTGRVVAGPRRAPRGRPTPDREVLVDP